MKRLVLILFLFIAMLCSYSQNEPAAPARDASAPTLNTTAAEIYYFHQDHLGSSAWVTDTLGHAVQHLCYLPWGERYISQKTGNFSTIYTFSGKERDEETGYSYFGQRFYDSELSFWLSVDPMRGKYPSLSPFVYCANNPIKLVDPNGMSIDIFDEEGNYTKTIKDNWFHNHIFGHIGRIIDKEGNIVMDFSYADPKHDYEDIKNRIIEKIQIVNEYEIFDILTEAGVFNDKNRENKWNFILEQGKGGGDMDFSYDLHKWYEGASEDPLENPSPIIFLIDGVAHNHMNFGNFLLGAGSCSLGFSMITTLLGGHYNSLFNSVTNNYPPQLDSIDDQNSISLGYKYASKHHYNK